MEEHMPCLSVVLEPDPRKNRKESLGDRRGGSVHCARNAGTLL